MARCSNQARQWKSVVCCSRGRDESCLLSANVFKVHITSVGILNVCNLWILLRKIVIYLVGRKCRLHGLFSC